MGSHTATGEWQSFELRMRRRRAERLVLRAEVAAEAGFADDARACLEEARRLAPGLAEIAAVQRRLDQPGEQAAAASAFPHTPVASAFRRKRAIFAAAAMATVALCAFVGARARTIPPAQDFRSLALPAAPAPPAGFRPAQFRPAQFREEFRLKAGATGTRESGTQVGATQERETGARLSEEIPVIATAPLQPLPRMTPPATEPPAALRVQNGLALATAGTFVPATVPAPAPLPAAGDEDAAVRRVLDRYAAAYTALDAAAAARLWPAVNREALGRAFDDLVSQRVSLGTCRVDVGASTAHAECAGSATWTPRVGDESPRTEDRRWSFELARAGGAWQIVSARVQNR